MPVYDFFCRRCRRPFVETMRVAQHDRTVPRCPTCEKKDKVEKRMSAFTAVTSRKSAAY